MAHGARAPSHTPILDIRTIAVERSERLHAFAAAGALVAYRDAPADLSSTTRFQTGALGSTARRINGGGLRLLATGQRRRRSALFLSDHNVR
ncbi:hypothetical protein EER27_08710 [Lysobacter psychrotolerans]|uniref:Uncharacterized protein n=1 Tax=Montanilutibacter psychrotolerans TaxID=1327343 RepID=A0A3M8SYW1_9GAMM|nr:hypothetical protein EER27_08710 [Lysobacter psychrotolerans]